MQLSLFQPSPLHTIEYDDPAILKVKSLLSGQIPVAALPPILTWFNTHEVFLLVTRGRQSKSGDFRPPKKGSLPVISVNKTLNEFAFLITLIHEMAHFHVYEKHHKPAFLKRKRRVQPHGKEWKEDFRLLMEPFLTLDVFPEKILKVLSLHMQNPRASTYSDPLLARLLLEYDSSLEGILIEELSVGAEFTTTSGMLFRKEGKLRKRYRCIRLKDRKIYLFSPLARVIPVKL
ncbi:sprT domain-containing protein [Bacteroidota bacterium]